MNQLSVVVVVAASCSPVSHAQTTPSASPALPAPPALHNNLATANNATWTIEITPVVVLKIRDMDLDTKIRVPVDSMVMVEVLAVCMTMVVNNLLVSKAITMMSLIQRMKGIGRSSVMLLNSLTVAAGVVRGVLAVEEEVVVASFSTLIVMGGGITRAMG